MTNNLALALVGLALAAGPALAADSKDKKEAQKVAPVTNKAATASKNKAADKGAQGGIILQSGQKGSDKGAKGGIILQNNAGKSTNMKTPAGKSVTPGG